MKYVSYVALEGLANRLRIHLVAQAYALHFNRKLVVNWSLVKAFGVRYSDLFLLDGCTELGRNPLESLDWHIRSGRTIRLNGRHRARDITELPNPRLGNVIFGEAYSPWVYENSGLMVGGYRDQVVSMLRPLSDWRSSVDSFASRLGTGAVGLHLRRGDFAISFPETQREPHAYSDLFDRVTAKFPGRSIFVATDDSDFIRQALGSRAYVTQEKCPRTSVVSAEEVFGYPNQCNRDTMQGAREAAIDLFTLARCAIVISEGASSFGRMAAFIGRSEFISIAEIESDHGIRV